MQAINRFNHFVQNNQRLAGILCAITASISFAFSLVLARFTYDYGTDVPTVLTIRFTMLLVLLLLWHFIRRQSISLPKALAVKSLAGGGLYFIGIGSYLASVVYLPVSLAVLIFYTFPILVTLFSALLEHRWPRPLEIIASLIAFIGLLIALNVQTEGLQWIGIGLAALSSLGVALNMIFSGYLLRYMPTSVFSVYTSITTILISAVLVINNGGLAMPEGSTGILAFIGMLVAFVIGYISIYTGISLMGAAPLSTIMNLEPVATIIVAAALLGEILTGQQVIGGLIVLSGILLAQWPKTTPAIKTDRSSP